MVNLLLIAWVPNGAPATRRRVFRGRCELIKRIAIAMGVMAVAVSLAGCATGSFSLEEQVGFDKATGGDITGVPPGLRFYGPADYVYPGQRAYLPPP
jgi:hypothetical protein